MKNEIKSYLEPEIIILALQNEDVLTTSGDAFAGEEDSLDGEEA